MPGVPLPLSRVSRRVLTCLPSMVIPKVLDVVLPRGAVEGTLGAPGSRGGYNCSCPESPPTPSGGQRDLLNLTGNLVKVSQARNCAFLSSPPVGCSGRTP